LAVTDAAALPGPFPLVVVSHGYGNDTAAFSWLGENLASKGYVVAAIRHIDPDYSDRTQFAWVLLRRPLDTVFVARELQASLGKAGLVDPSRTALVGYSMGGYAVLTAGGATLDPAGQTVAQMPGQALTPYARGGAKRDWLRVPNLKAVVALAPAGGGASPAWGKPGLADLTAPLLLIAGNQDRTVNYETGARSFFDDAVHSPRYLLTYREGGHAIGMGPPAPPEMRGRLWDLDWFEDPVWRKDRILAINLHFITAFLDRYVKDDASRTDYLQGLVPESNAGRWPGKPAAPYAAVSPGGPGITLWKGFQDRHAAGLQLEYREAQP
jgi:predicted dienelactone hydrolase